MEHEKSYGVNPKHKTGSGKNMGPFENPTFVPSKHNRSSDGGREDMPLTPYGKKKKDSRKDSQY